MTYKSPNILNYREFKRHLDLEIMKRDEALDTRNTAQPEIRENIYAHFYKNVDGLFDDTKYWGNPRVRREKKRFDTRTKWKTLFNPEARHGRAMANTDLISNSIPAYRLNR
jgi:hypothetical protein